MARTKKQMQRMLMRMKLLKLLKHDIRYAQHFAKMNSEGCQASGGTICENS